MSDEPWVDENNELIRALPAYNADVVVLDWAWLAPGCPEACVADGGVDDVGAEHFVQLMLDLLQPQ